MASVPTSIRPMDFGSNQRQLKEALSTYNDEEVDVQTIESEGIDVFAVVSVHIHWCTLGQDPGYQIWRLPALEPSRDPGFPWLIRTSPINRTRNKDS